MTPTPGPDEPGPAAGLGRFAALASHPVARRLGPPSAVARLPLGMTTLALLLLVQRDSGSFVVAGAVTASFALASGVTSPVRGRLVDRLGPVPVLLSTGVLQPVALVSVVASSTWAASPTGALVSAGAAGALLPPVGPVVRVLWQGLPSGGLRDAAFAADSILLQVVYYGAGPSLVTVWMAGFLIIAGFSVAPASIVQFRLVGGLAPADVITESFTWLLSAVLAGTALGNVVAGGLVDVAGSSVALCSAFLTATASAVLSLFGGGRPPPT